MSADLRELIEKHGPVHLWEWVPCPCLEEGPQYDDRGPDLDGSPLECELCEGQGEIPSWSLEEHEARAEEEES